jgi:hypothetical protein
MSRAVLTDEILIERVLGGSKECFDALYERHFQRVYNFVSRRVGEGGEAEDLTQEIFIQAVTSLANYRAKGSFLHWLSVSPEPSSATICASPAAEEFGGRRPTSTRPRLDQDTITPSARQRRSWPPCGGALDA